MRHLHGSSTTKRQIQILSNNISEGMFLFKAEPYENQDGQHERMRRCSGDWKMEQLKGRIIYKGKAEGEALVTSQPISFYGGVDPNTGVVTEKGHELQGHKRQRQNPCVSPRQRLHSRQLHTLPPKEKRRRPSRHDKQRMRNHRCSRRHHQRNPLRRQN